MNDEVELNGGTSFSGGVGGETPYYFSGGINDRSEKGYYDKGTLFFEPYLICPICKQKFDPKDVRHRVGKLEYNDGSMKLTNYITCPWGHEVNVGTDIRNYNYIDYGYME